MKFFCFAGRSLSPQGQLWAGVFSGPELLPLREVFRSPFSFSDFYLPPHAHCSPVPLGSSVAVKREQQAPHSEFTVMITLHDSFKFRFNHSIFHVRWFSLFGVISC